MPHRLLTCVFLLATTPALGQSLSPRETRIRHAVLAGYDATIDLLRRSVNTSSGTFNQGGVRAVGALYRRELDALGFTTRWIELPPALKRAGHLWPNGAGLEPPPRPNGSS